LVVLLIVGTVDFVVGLARTNVAILWVLQQGLFGKRD
jgi:hypothetical protein